MGILYRIDDGIAEDDACAMLDGIREELAEFAAMVQRGERSLYSGSGRRNGRLSSEQSQSCKYEVNR